MIKDRDKDEDEHERKLQHWNKKVLGKEGGKTSEVEKKKRENKKKE